MPKKSANLPKKRKNLPRDRNKPAEGRGQSNMLLCFKVSCYFRPKYHVTFTIKYHVTFIQSIMLLCFTVSCYFAPALRRASFFFGWHFVVFGAGLRNIGGFCKIIGGHAGGNAKASANIGLARACARTPYSGFCGISVKGHRSACKKMDDMVSLQAFFSMRRIFDETYDCCSRHHGRGVSICR